MIRSSSPNLSPEERLRKIARILASSILQRQKDQGGLSEVLFVLKPAQEDKQSPAPANGVPFARAQQGSGERLPEAGGNSF